MDLLHRKNTQALGEVVENVQSSKSTIKFMTYSQSMEGDQNTIMVT